MASLSSHKQTYQMILMLGLMSAGLLAAAFAFEIFGGLLPCKLCIWQRWPHALIIVICPQLAFCVICMYLPHITVHDLVVVDHHVSLMSLAFGGRGYIVKSRDTETDAGIGIEFDSTLGKDR